MRIILFILLMVILGTEGCKSKQVETVNIDGEKIIQEKEFVNPLPKDKFVFVEVHTHYKDKVLKGDPFKNGPYYNKNNKKYIGFPMIKPIFGHFEFDEKKETLTLLLREGNPVTEDTLLVINIFFRGESIGPGEFGTGGGNSFHKIINSLPFLMADFWKEDREREEGFILAHRNIYFIKIYRDGAIKFKYGEDKQIILEPGDSWNTTEEIIEEFMNERKERLKVKFTTEIAVVNRGILNKNKVKIFHTYKEYFDGQKESQE